MVGEQLGLCGPPGNCEDILVLCLRSFHNSHTLPTLDKPDAYLCNEILKRKKIKKRQKFYVFTTYFTAVLLSFFFDSKLVSLCLVRAIIEE